MRTRNPGSGSRRRALIPLCALPLCLAVGSASAQELDCLIQPKQSITVASAVEGVVDKVLVDRGDLVEKGQVLATLRSDVERASLEVARARAKADGRLVEGSVRVEFAERSVSRSSALSEKEIVSVEQVDEVMRDKRLAEALLQEAREAKQVAELDAKRAAAVLAMRTIRSPVRGVVVERILSPGEYADPPQVLELAQIDPLSVEVFAPLSLLGRIQLGTEADVLPEEPVGGVYRARVTALDRVVEAASGTFGVRLELPNPELSLPAGVKCRIRFAANGSAAAPVPGAGTE